MTSLIPKAYVFGLTAAEIEQRLNSLDNFIQKDVIRQSLNSPAVDAIPSTKAVSDALDPIQTQLQSLGDLAGKDSVSLDSEETAGVLPLNKGGTGGNTVELARQNLGILTQDEIQNLINESVSEIGSVDLSSAQVTNVLPVVKGGTGANTPSQARANLGVWSSAQSKVVKTNTKEALRRSYAEAGYNVVGTFQEGFTLVNANDVGIDEINGKGYTGPAGTVAAGTDPASGGFVDVSGRLLRNIPAPNNTVFLSTLSDIAQGAEIHISRFLPESARAAIFDGTSTADLTQYVQDAVDSGSSAITFANVKKLNVGEVNLPSADVMLLGRGGNINGISGGRIFKATARGKLTTIEGFIFTGNATAYDYASDGGTVPHGSQLYEYVLSDNRYLMQGNIPAIRLYGAREGVIFGGYMLGNKGIYTEFSINTSIIGLQAKNCDYVVLSKLGSEGLICSHLVALGCSYGLRCERTTGVQLTNSMLDYCDLPLRMVGATDVEVSNNYLSTRTQQGVLHLSTYTDGFRGLRHKYIGNTMQSNYNAAGDVVAILNDNDYVDFFLNTVRGFTGTGVKYDNLTQSDIAFNKIVGKGTDANERSIYCSGTDSPSVNVERNRVTSKIGRTHYANTSKNAGFRTEASGTATVPNGAVSVTVPHGLPITPTADKIRLTAGGGAISGRQLYVNNVTATTFDIQVAGGAVTANLPVFWAISNIL